MRFIELICLYLLLNLSNVNYMQADCIHIENEISERTFDWIPPWRDKMDCGPNALYVLMNLEGIQVSLADTKQHVSVNEKYGCSIRSLINAADHFDFSLEARFVSPNDVCKLPRPFILHGLTSHEKKLV